MSITAPRFDWSFNFGHVIQSLTMFITVAGGIWWTSAKFENIENRLSTAELRATVWVPRVEAMMKSDTIQDERIKNIIEATKDNREVQGEILKKVSSLSEDMISIKARLGVARP